MSGNLGRFVDLTPNICPAGQTFGDYESVKSCLSEYKLADGVKALKHDAKIWKTDKFVLPRKLPPFKNPSHCGAFTQIKETLNPPLMTRYQTVINDLKETSYNSYWNARLGKTRNEVPGIPKGMNPETVTFGIATKKEIGMKELVNPPKTVYEVLYDSQVGHEAYIKTHNDYNPGEQVNRKYEEPAFSRDRRYGMRYNYDERGIGMQCCTEWFDTELFSITSRIRADFVSRNRPSLGKSYEPNQNINCVPVGHSFGTKTKWDLYGAGNLLKDAEEKQGFMPLELFYKICMCKKLHITEELENYCRLFKIIQNDKIDYKAFTEIVDPLKPLMEIMKIDDIPESHQYWMTTYQAANCDRFLIDNSGMKPAGVPLIRYDEEKPSVPMGQCRADLENLGNDTSANTLLNPSIYTSFGLTYRDFFKPRSADVLRNLFEGIGYTFPKDMFEELWKMGVEHDGTGLVCVDTFKKLLKCHYPTPKLIVDEAEI